HDAGRCFKFIGCAANVTSSDENHPPENTIHGSVDAKSWKENQRSGALIQCAPSLIMSLHLDFISVKRLRIEKGSSDDADKFEAVADTDRFESSDTITHSKLRSNNFFLFFSLQVNVSNTTHLRFLILSGYEHFVSVHKVSVQS
uniref:Uncharacterized protein n=1 Tax=Cyprinus carpio TaxID=7962 RepID=A0A8C1ITN2_CYPCA